ncbi:MAG TPA: FG-GAP-like repeat-containing protein, partial [Planctomycetota bacterium]|nr:FG-GAP-like repeat-containing protein [Planctomycetota bacterium]
MAARAWAFLLLLALPDEPDRILSDGSVRGFYGEAFALADVNGDGFRDLIVGAPGWPDSSSEIGRAYLHLGGPAGPSATPVWTSSGDAAPQSFFGRQVVAAGDVNGDGFGDVLVGAQAGAFDKVFLFFGHSGGLSAAAGWTLVPGHHVSFDWAGDVNGDGFGDVVLGWMDGAGVGVAALYTGNPGGMSEGAVWQVEGYEGPVAGASDVNRDGFSDVLVARNNDVAVF